MSTTSRRSFLGAVAAAPAAAGSKTGAKAFRARVHPLEGLQREKLKITDVKVTLMSYELKDKAWVTAKQLVWKSDSVLVEIFTDKGIVGIGESSPYAGPEWLKQTIEQSLKPVVLGKNPFDVEHLATAWTGARPSFAAWAGIDAACWDIIGKAVNMPVYKLLATDAPPEPHIRMYASGGVEYAWYKRPEDLIDEAVRHKEEGYTAFKFRIGAEWANCGMTVGKYIPYLHKLREAVGPGMDLMHENNMRLTLAETLELCPVFDELNFRWLEEPVRTNVDGALEDHLKIKAALRKTPISGGESRGNRFEFKEWIDRGAYDIVQPDCNVTGITEAWHIARIANLTGRACCPHNWHGGLTTMANAALVAGIPNRLMLELNQTFNPFKEEIFKDPLVVRKGYMDLPDKPGLGLELTPGVARRFPYLPGNYWKPNPNLPGA
ncbi:MAG: mandelate racemase/muconate lactonizing enzyme family protein [Bryobacteraceae bacterium]|nr:mandelate racemase/muconate lactonizing enzyme family protein [Bryobacteraceae bacterium]